MSDEELRLEIEKGPASRFGPKIQPVLRTALFLRESAEEAKARGTDIEIAREANRIAADALEEAKRANRKSDKARFWSAIAVLLAATAILVSFFSA